MTVVFDSCIWISALRFGGIPRAAILQAIAKDHIAISDIIERETLRSSYRNFATPEESTASAMAVFLEDAPRITITETVAGVCRDPNDDHVLECAQKANAELIISGDKDLLTLVSFGSIRILTARQYLDLP